MNTTPRLTFAARLRSLRTAAGLTQAQLAERAGMTGNGVQQLEAGRREPALETAVRLADGLGVSLALFHPAAVLPGEPAPKKKPAPKRSGKRK